MVELNNLKTKKIFYNEKMKKHCTFQIGGTAFLYVETSYLTDIQKIMRYAKKINKRLFFIGLGANILFSSHYIDAIFVKYINKKYMVENNKIICSSGANLYAIIRIAYDYSLSGLEFLTGIPSSIGGAVVGNAGGVEKSISDLIEWVEIYDNFKTKILSKEECKFKYRSSIFKTKNFFIKRICLNLEKSDKKLIKDLMLDFADKKIKSQPLNYPSAGSIFKRLGNFIPAYYIDKLGLKGTQVGGAIISHKHAGFIVNTKKATSKDVLILIKKIQDIIFENYKIMLEKEIIYID